MQIISFMTLLLLLCGGIGVSRGAAVDPKSLGYNTGVNPHPHNLSRLNSDGGGIHAPAGGESQICKFCHTPHGASAAGPLWNRQDPLGRNGDGTFPLYGSSSIVIDDAGAVGSSGYGVGTYPNGASRLCMSCHDGVTAVGEVISEATLANLTMSASGTIDLSTSHPISFVYDATVAGLINAVKNDGGSNTYQLPGTAGILDAQARMQCTACHDPHIDTNDGTYTLPMWRNYTGVENTDYEGTCSECHVGGSGSAGILRSPVPGIGANHQL